MLKFIYRIEKQKDMDQANKVLKDLIKSGSKLIFTVDCGTLSFDIIDLFQKKILMF